MNRTDRTRARPALPRSVAAGLLALAALPAGPARADDGFRGWLQGGWAFPADPPEFWELWDGGWSVGGGLGFRVSPEWEVATTLHVHRFPIDEPAQIDDLLLQGPGVVVPILGVDGREVTSVTLLAETRFHFASPEARVDPFLGFGWGYFRLEEADAAVTAADPRIGTVTVLGRTEDAFASSVGAGVAWRWTARVRLVLDGVWTIGFTEPTSTQFLPVRLGIVID